MAYNPTLPCTDCGASGTALPDQASRRRHAHLFVGDASQPAPSAAADLRLRRRAPGADLVCVATRPTIRTTRWMSERSSVTVSPSGWIDERRAGSSERLVGCAGPEADR